MVRVYACTEEHTAPSSLNLRSVVQEWLLLESIKSPCHSEEMGHIKAALYVPLL